MAKITFLGNFSVDYSSESHHAKTLESLGHEVVRFQEGKDKSEDIYRSAIKSNLFIWIHTHGWTTPGRLSMTKVLDNLKRYNVLSITYHLDLWFGLDRQSDLEQDDFYKSIGYFFTVDKLMADWFNENTKVKGRFVPAGVYDKECYIHEDYDRNDFQYDVIFVGSKGYHPEHKFRPQLIDFLRETYKDKFLHVGGDGDTGTVRGHDLNKIYAMNKIAVGDSLNLNFDYPYYTSDRLFESTGRGGFTIYPRIVGLEKYFNDNEIVWYEHGNFDDLKLKIDYYLKHDEKRENIRFAGHERTKNEHTYIQRWQYILSQLKI